MTSQDRAQFSAVNIQDGAERNVIASFLFGLQLNLTMITVHFEASFRVGRTKLTPERIETSDKMRENVRISRRSLYKLANELRVNRSWKFFILQRKFCGFKNLRMDCVSTGP